MKTKKSKRTRAALITVAALAFGTFAPASFSFMNDSITEVKASARWESDPYLFITSDIRDTTDYLGKTIHRFRFWYGDITVGYYDDSDEAFIMHVSNSPLYSDEIFIPEEIGGKKITSIDYNAFNNCRCDRVVLPDTIKSIDDCGFYCSKIKELIIPDSVESIGNDAFAFSNFEKLTMPKSVTTVKRSAFDGCSSLRSLEFKGPVTIEDNAFANCESLEEITFPEGSSSIAEHSPFYNCPKLKKVNGMEPYSYQTDSSGNKKPVLNEKMIPLIKEYFKSADAIGFINDYCTDMCNYVVASETDPWMNDFLKARQLHDWLVRHCVYEDLANGESYSDTDNHLSSTVFLSIGLNERGEELGEAVCDSFSRAYTMLLSAADIESYQISAYDHSWNAVVIDGQYYECDAAWDSAYYHSYNDYDDYSTYYKHFMKSNKEMISLHGQRYNNPYNSIIYSRIYHNHPLISKYMNFDFNKCVKEPTGKAIFQDDNKDGIRDYDYDLDGSPLAYDFTDDLTAVHLLQNYIFPTESEATMNNRLGECLYNLHLMHKSWWEFVGR